MRSATRSATADSLIQPAPHSVLPEYPVRIIVAGSRGFENYHLFSEVLADYLRQFGDTPVIFISGAARSGADALIIRWCKEHHKPWVEFPAEWNNFDHPDSKTRINRFGKKYNALAGMIRNEKMAEHGTHLLAFWTGQSSGTFNMISHAKVKERPTKVILIDTEKS